MVKKTDRPARLPVRERLLAAADTLFYEEGFNTVGIERVLDLAGVAKASLYDSFGSKEELVRAYLAEKHEARKTRFNDGLPPLASPRDRLLSMFDILSRDIGKPTFRGCAFVKAGIEARRGSSVMVMCETSRTWMRETFSELVAATGAPDPQGLARQLMMLYDGAAMAAQLDHNLDAAKQAREVAAVMLDQAITTAS